MPACWSSSTPSRTWPRCANRSSVSRCSACSWRPVAAYRREGAALLGAARQRLDETVALRQRHHAFDLAVAHAVLLQALCCLHQVLERRAVAALRVLQDAQQLLVRQIARIARARTVQ